MVIGAEGADFESKVVDQLTDRAVFRGQLGGRVFLEEDKSKIKEEAKKFISCLGEEYGNGKEYGSEEEWEKARQLFDARKLDYGSGKETSVLSAASKKEIEGLFKKCIETMFPEEVLEEASDNPVPGPRGREKQKLSESSGKQTVKGAVSEESGADKGLKDQESMKTTAARVQQAVRGSSPSPQQVSGGSPKMKGTESPVSTGGRTADSDVSTTASWTSSIAGGVGRARKYLAKKYEGMSGVMQEIANRVNKYFEDRKKTRAIKEIEREKGKVFQSVLQEKRGSVTSLFQFRGSIIEDLKEEYRKNPRLKDEKDENIEKLTPSQEDSVLKAYKKQVNKSKDRVQDSIIDVGSRIESSKQLLTGVSREINSKKMALQDAEKRYWNCRMSSSTYNGSEVGTYGADRLKAAVEGSNRAYGEMETLKGELLGLDKKKEQLYEKIRKEQKRKRELQIEEAQYEWNQKVSSMPDIQRSGRLNSFEQQMQIISGIDKERESLEGSLQSLKTLDKSSYGKQFLDMKGQLTDMYTRLNNAYKDLKDLGLDDPAFKTFDVKKKVDEELEPIDKEVRARFEVEDRKDAEIRSAKADVTRYSAEIQKLTYVLGKNKDWEDIRVHGTAGLVQSSLKQDREETYRGLGKTYMSAQQYQQAIQQKHKDLTVAYSCLNETYKKLHSLDPSNEQWKPFNVQGVVQNEMDKIRENDYRQMEQEESSLIDEADSARGLERREEREEIRSLFRRDGDMLEGKLREVQQTLQVMRRGSHKVDDLARMILKSRVKGREEWRNRLGR